MIVFTSYNNSNILIINQWLKNMIFVFGFELDLLPKYYTVIFYNI